MIVFDLGPLYLSNGAIFDDLERPRICHANSVSLSVRHTRVWSIGLDLECSGLVNITE